MSFNRFGFLFILGVIGALVVLVQPGYVAERWSAATISRSPIADPAPLPCKQQDWWNADRACLSWTAPR
jgi:hypothetical protein